MRLDLYRFPYYVRGNFISNTSHKIAIVPRLARPKLFLNLGNFFNNSLPDMLFIICTTSAGAYLGI